MSSLASELRRLVAGLLLSLPLAALATVPEETFLPPQNIPLPGTMTFGKMVVADVNGDHYDDIVVIGSDVIDPDASTSMPQLVIDLYLNEGKTRRTDEAVSFNLQRLPLAPHANREAAEADVRFGAGNDLQVVDLDGDGLPDILASDASTGQIFVLWNQGTNAPKMFAYMPDTDLPTAPSMTLLSPLAQRVGGDGVLGTPIFVAAADLGDGTGRKSIVAYHGALPLDSSSHDKAPFNRGNYESLAIISPTAHTARGFNLFTQRVAWPGCDLAFGSSCPGWSDGMTASTSLYNFRLADQSQPSLGFDSAPSDVIDMDGWTTVGSQTFYKPATFHPNAAPGLQVLTGHGANGSDSIWLQGGGQVHEFVADNTLKLMRQRTAIDAAIATVLSPLVTVKERSAGSTFGSLRSGQEPLITAGGMRVVYEPSNPASAVDQPVPDYLIRDGQIGGWLGWAPLNTSSALLSLSDYCRAPDPCVRELSWYHAPLDGTPSPASFWGGSRTLVMLDFAKETTTASGTQYEPFFQKPDDARFQAFSIMGGSLTHKPFIASGHFASPTEAALIMLDHADGKPTDPLWNHLALYRPDVAKTYRSPIPHIDGFAIGEYIHEGMVERVGSFDQGKKSMVILGSHFGLDTPDAVRYVTVRDAVTHAVQGIFPGDVPEPVKDTAMSGSTLTDGIVVPGLSTLALGRHEVQVHNANAESDWVALSVGNPHGIVATNYDWLAGRTCGLVPNTKDGNLWPKQIAVSTTGFVDGELQAVRWVKSHGAAVEVPATGYATFDAASSTVTLTVPQGKLSDGAWTAYIKAANTWIKVPRAWHVVSGGSTLDTCAAQVDLVIEEAYAQCNSDDYYLEPADYNVFPNYADGTFRYFGSGFTENQIQAVALKQLGHRYFSQSVEVISDNELHVNFGLLKDLTPNVPLDLYFYAADSGVVEKEGVPARGSKLHWRTVRNGICHQSMPHYSSVSGATGKDGAFQAGDVITAIGENLMYPVPTANRLILTDQNSGAKYALPSYLPEDFYVKHYDNTNGKLLFVIPNDEDWESYKIADGEGVVEGWAPPPYVSYVIEAGTTAATEASVSAWTASSGVLGGFTAGIYLSGNSPTGVLNWIASKLGSGSKPAPGKPGDDQPRNDSLYVVTYISNDGIFHDGNLYVAVFRSRLDDAYADAQKAIYLQGRGTYPSTQNISIWPYCSPSDGAEIYACMTSVDFLRSTVPNGVSIPYGIGQWELRWTPGGTLTGQIEKMAVGTTQGFYALIPRASPDAQFSWRMPLPERGYDWVRFYSIKPQVLVTNAATDCTAVLIADDVCFQQNLLP